MISVGGSIIANNSVRILVNVGLIFVTSKPVMNIQSVGEGVPAHNKHHYIAAVHDEIFTDEKLELYVFTIVSSSLK